MGASFSVFVAGRAIPQGSMRHLGKGKLTHDNPKLKAWRRSIAWTVRAVVGAAVLDPADRVTVRCHFLIRPTRKGDAPDLDKLVRAVLDALSHVAFVDDKQVEQIDARRTLARVNTHDELPFMHEALRLVPNAPFDDPEGLLLTVETT